jgi:hypothetical protein
MSTATAPFGRPHWGYSSFASSGGVGDIANRIGTDIRDFASDAQRSATGQVRLVQPWAALVDEYSDARDLAGDGEFAVPSAAAMQEAKGLLEALPAWAPSPTPIVEPSGTIALEWDLGANRFLVFAVNGTGRLQHSAILGLGNEYYGSTNFTGALPLRAQTLLADLLLVQA